MLHTNWGRSNYNALQTEFTLRPTQGTSFQATWAWDKIMDFPPPYDQGKSRQSDTPGPGAVCVLM